MSDERTIELRAAIQADVRRVADRLRNAPVRKVEAALTPTRELLQLLADAAAGIDGRDETTAPRWREVPALPDAALGDQLAVLGADLLAAAADLGDDAPGWTRAGRTDAAGVLALVADALVALRRSL